MVKGPGGRGVRKHTSCLDEEHLPFVCSRKKPQYTVTACSGEAGEAGALFSTCPESPAHGGAVSVLTAEVLS